MKAFQEIVKEEKKALARAQGGEGNALQNDSTPGVLERESARRRRERRSTRRVSRTGGDDPDDMTILRRREVERRIGLLRSTIYELIAQGKFPRPIRLGPRSVGWLASEIEDWIAARIAERDAACAPTEAA